MFQVVVADVQEPTGGKAGLKAAKGFFRGEVMLLHGPCGDHDGRQGQAVVAVNEGDA